MHVLHVVGARPNFMKVSPVMRAFAAQSDAAQTLVHTGQHYDANMSDAFFRQLGLPEPDVNLGVGSGSHAVQTAQMMIGLETCLLERQPDLLMVYGDVNSTAAAALVAAKLGIAVAHVEAGLRSRDRSMPEEINRMMTDRLSDHLFTPSPDADDNLLREGVAPESIHLVGNVMIDTLVRLQPSIDSEAILRTLGLLNGSGPRPFALVTLHRPSNVDRWSDFCPILRVLTELAQRDPGRLSRPSSHARSSRAGSTSGSRSHPLAAARIPRVSRPATARRLVITDSGGIQEETTYLGVPCLTVRDTTERPITVDVGTNVLIGRDMERLRRAIAQILNGHAKRGRVPPLWDGHAAERIARIVLQPAPCERALAGDLIQLGCVPCLSISGSGKGQ